MSTTGTPAPTSTTTSALMLLRTVLSTSTLGGVGTRGRLELEALSPATVRDLADFASTRNSELAN